MSTTFDYLPPEAGFLEPDRDLGRAGDAARAVVVPFGLEATVSYGTGTAAGPAAILAASHQLELFDEELWREPYREYGIATLEPPPIAPKIEDALTQLGQVVDRLMTAGRFPLVLGGEHALTPAAVRAVAAHHENLVVLQIDAHADLRDGYLGEHFSHASAMRRVLDIDGVSLVSVGIRAISEAEAAFYEANRDRVEIHWAKDQANWDPAGIAARLAGRPVYVTFDIDGLDAAHMPATGTPTPGGLDYWQALAILRHTAEVATIVAADVVELAPISGFHAYDYTAAAIAYKLMSYALSGTAPAT